MGGIWTRRRPATSFNEVLELELAHIHEARGDGDAGKRKSRDAFTEAHEAELAGLALSGGGIRSATFNLGILQGLADLGLLDRFDYLSTVSGGGYIGSWLTAWISRTTQGIREERKKENKDASDAPARAVGEVARRLRPGRRGRSDTREQKEVRFLRDFSNYLTPRKSFLSTDTWSFVSTYLRNLNLNLITLILTLVAALIVPHIAILLFKGLAQSGGDSLLVYAGLLLLLAFISVFEKLSSLTETKPARKGARGVVTTVIGVQFTILLPILLAAWLLSAWLFAVPAEYRQEPFAWMWITGVGYMVLWIVGWAVTAARYRGNSGGSKATPSPESERSADPRPLEKKSATSGTARRIKEMSKKALAPLPLIVSALVAGFAGGGMLFGVAALFDLGEPALKLHHAGSWGMPLVLVVFLSAATLHIGLTGTGFSDEAHEWWSRLGASICIWILVLTVLFGISVYGPAILDVTDRLVRRIAFNFPWFKETLGAVWAAITGAGLVAAKGPKKNPGPVVGAVGKIAPYVFVAGLLLGLSLLTHKAVPSVLHLVHETQFLDLPSLVHPGGLGRAECLGHERLSQIPLDAGLLVCFLVVGGTAVLLSWRVGVNKFSMHALYRNRLVRCYLGASNERRADPYTGFDQTDDVAELSTLVDDCPRPYPIVNTTLNLVSGRRLAWQQRKAASFTFTPKFCGFDPRDEEAGDRPEWLDPNGYRPTKSFGGRVSLGTAMAISGAAASPNMGYHTSTALAFLMTVFNVRLGWWFGNTRRYPACNRPGPRIGLLHLVSELFGLTDDRRRYVYLSDGGHFENLGIYELVRRRCRFIVACDAGQDRDMNFADLGNAVEKCRTDFGIDIQDLNIEPIRDRDENGNGEMHCVVGRIRYDKVDDDGSVGILVYVKSSLTGDEAADVRRYAARHPEFPHEPTWDQWFGESQFESYRKLGYHIANEVFRAVGNREELKDLTNELLFQTLRERWYPKSAAPADAFTRLAGRLDDIIKDIAANEDLRFLDIQVYPEWRTMRRDVAKDAPKEVHWLPRDFETLRNGFYMCNRVIQLMEDVYLDLDLEVEEERRHPDNRGWMNLFRQWSWSNMLRVTWTISAGTYGARFQNFCEQHLGLEPGRVEAVPLTAKASPEVRSLDGLLDQAEEQGRLNFLEVDLIKRFAYEHEDSVNTIYLLKSVVEDPFRRAARDAKIEFTFGFALVDAGNHLVYLRVQDHLRQMGLARKAVLALIDGYDVKRYRLRKLSREAKEPTRPEHVELFARLFDSALAEHEEKKERDRRSKPEKRS